MRKSTVNGKTATLNQMGRSYYCFCLEQALQSVRQARALVQEDVIELDHKLPTLERLITEALDAS